MDIIAIYAGEHPPTDATNAVWNCAENYRLKINCMYYKNILCIIIWVFFETVQSDLNYTYLVKVDV